VSAFAYQLHPALLVQGLKANREAPETPDVAQHLIHRFTEGPAIVPEMSQGE
jgi:hypothetical protein